MANKSYHEQFKNDTNLRLRNLLKQLPPFLTTFFRGIEPTTSARTRMAYCYDLKIFFTFLKTETSLCPNKEITEFEIEVLDKVKPSLIQDYLDYIKIYRNSKNESCSNSERGLMRKLSSLRSMYNYYYRMEMIKTNPAQIIQMPKLHDKEIIRLDKDEVSELLYQVETGKSLSKQQQNFHDKTKVRDLAIVTLLLGTGIRVSECVGLDLNDVDFKNHGIRITRKGGNQVVVYFGDEVEEALFDYYRERSRIIPISGHEDALFLSIQKRRITVKSVERLVKKYSGLVTQLKKITPHKLRSTFGTQLYKETGDIYLVADVLGHSDVNTTKKHYAAIEDERRRMARNMVTLRSDETSDMNKHILINEINKDIINSYSIGQGNPATSLSAINQSPTDEKVVLDTINQWNNQNKKQNNNKFNLKSEEPNQENKIDEEITTYDLDLDDLDFDELDIED